MTVLYTKYVNEPGRDLSSFALYSCTIPLKQLTIFLGRCSDGQFVATINKWKQTKNQEIAFYNTLSLTSPSGNCAG